MASGNEERSISSSITAAATARDDAAIGELYAAPALPQSPQAPRMAKPINLQRMRRAGAIAHCRIHVLAVLQSYKRLLCAQFHKRREWLDPRRGV